jgi:soluble lytic murein transglycosylase
VQKAGLTPTVTHKAPVSKDYGAALAAFARGVRLFAQGSYATALPLVNDPALAFTPLADYARYYAASAQLRLDRVDDAKKTLDSMDDHPLIGYLAEAVPIRRSEVELARKNPSSALSMLESLSSQKLSSTEDVLLRTGRAAEQAGENDQAIAAYRRLYFEFPLSAEADIATLELARIDPAFGQDRFKLEFSRAERLFSARRYQPAHDGFERLARTASGEDKDLIALRLAESDYYLGRYRQSRDALRSFLTRGPREAEARFFYLTATRALGNDEEYLSLAQALVNDFPNDAWTEETLNNLASHYIKTDDDESADRVLRDLYQRFPRGRYAERAAWKIGWAAYRAGRYTETIRYFEGAAAAFPRADTRPAWLYWSARARERLGETGEANARYRLTATDYLNSYYGRLAAKHLDGTFDPQLERAALGADVAGESRSAPNQVVIRQLLSLELYDDAQREVQYAQHVWGDSSALQATLAWIRHANGLTLTARERFDNLRGAINMMKRAYPQYIAAGGEKLPPEVLGVVYPLDYWLAIKRNAEANGLDPYLMAALVNQESTFTADIKSAANAVGLMQLIPKTGRRYAKTLKISYTSHTLTQPEPNIRLGMAYFKDLVDRFGGACYALASYNAGENRVAKWRADKPNAPEDEFIDDIPFPETQNYVKKILSMTEDYRRLYGGGLLDPESGLSHRPVMTRASASTASHGSNKTHKATAKSSTKRKHHKTVRS